MRELALNINELSSLADEVLSASGLFTFQASVIASGYSMTPFIYPGDILTIETVSIEKLKPGHVVLFKNDEVNMIAHRVVRKLDIGGEFHVDTMGDASFESDGLTGADEIIGRVVNVRRGRRVISMDKLPNCALGYLWAKLSPFRPTIIKIYTFLRHFSG